MGKLENRTHRTGLETVSVLSMLVCIIYALDNCWFVHAATEGKKETDEKNLCNQSTCH